MKTPDTFKGFVYQEKCALWHVLRELARPTGMIAFRMDHPNGDDLDLMFPDKLWIWQTKDESAPHLPTYLLKMWRRYTENIRGNATRCVKLGFIFSMTHPNNAALVALRSHAVDVDELRNAMATVNGHRLTQFRVQSLTEWMQFLRDLEVKVLEVDYVESEIKVMLGCIFLQYRAGTDRLDALESEFLGRLNEVMQRGREVPLTEVREVIDRWFVQLAINHPAVRLRVAALLQDAAKGLRAPPEVPPPSVSGDDTP